MFVTQATDFVVTVICSVATFFVRTMISCIL